MAVRGDIYVDWDADPRIIWVQSPSTSVSIQDLVDTCRELEADMINLAYPFLIAAAGKEPLGGGVFVGITATLQNAVVAFEARPGPTYEQCNISGGNLVAVDENGDIISPIFPTAFTQIVRTSSSSATLLESASIEYSSFNGRVTIDVVNGTAGTSYPTGTEQQPVNNLDDALLIAQERGFSELHLMSDLTIPTGTQLDGITINSLDWLNVTVESGVSLEGTVFEKVSLYGVMSGIWNVIVDCWVYEITNFSGWVRGGSIGSVSLAVGLGGEFGGQSFFDNLVPLYPGVTSTVTMNTDTQVSFTNNSDIVTIENMTAGSIMECGLLEGKLIIEASCTGGNINVTGLGEISNLGTATVDVSGLVNPNTVSDATWDETLAAHTVSGSAADKMKKNLTTGTFIALK